MSAAVPQARATILIENERVRVTEWRFAAGAATGFHRHPFDYVVVPLTSGTLTLIAADGAHNHADLRVGDPYFREAGVEHDVRFEGPGEFVFVETELKEAKVAPGR